MAESTGSHHTNWWIPVKKLKRIFNPFSTNTWAGVETPISQTEVARAIEDGRLHEDWCKSGPLWRKVHIERIAHFVVRGWKSPIVLEILPVKSGKVTPLPITDGNHRFAASVFRGDDWILAHIKGDVRLARQVLKPHVFEENRANCSNRADVVRKVRCNDKPDRRSRKAHTSRGI